MSALEEQFHLQLRLHKLDHLFRREFRFHPKRLWRIDFADPVEKLAIELQGGIFGKKSGHNTGVGIRNDMEKSNELQRLGWRVFHFYVDDVKSGKAINYLLTVLKESRHAASAT
jgi:very-short-patch-repair endonuclease